MEDGMLRRTIAGTPQGGVISPLCRTSTCRHLDEAFADGAHGRLVRYAVSGRMLERGVRRYYLQRWPSQRAMKRVRGKIKAKTGRGRAGQDIREVIAELNPVVRGWGNYFRTGNAAQFNQIDGYVVGRLRGLMVRRYGRNLKAGQASTWTREWSEAHGLSRLRGTIRYPGYAS